MSQPPGPQGPYQQYPGQNQPPGGGYPGGPGGPGGPGPQPGGGYGPPPGPPPGVDPYGDSGGKKSKLPWILGGVGLLVAAGVAVVLIFVLGGGGASAGSPTELADDVVKAMNERDAEGLAEMGCEGSSAESKEKVQEGLDQLDLSKNPNIPAQVRDLVKDIKISFTRGKVQESGETATADIQTKFDNVPAQLEGQIPAPTLKLQMKDEGGWCATDMGVGGGGPPAP